MQAREGLDHTEALRYWKEVHAPIVARVPGLRRYVQNQCIAGILGAGEPPFLGVGEVSFDTEEEEQEALATPEWKAVPDDAATFMDMSGVAAGWPQVHQIV
ncbi:MAG: EthD family reductase [Actinobacteria bacterium]|nr:EthD family reductase [Actinomycetota bacterium]